MRWYEPTEEEEDDPLGEQDRLVEIPVTVPCRNRWKGRMPVIYDVEQKASREAGA